MANKFTLDDLKRHASGTTDDPAFVSSLMTHVVELETQLRDQKELIASLERDAYYDSLTSLGNRRLFEKEIQRTLSACRRYGRYGALLVVDLNSFKDINDKLGHLAGDQVLIHVAHLLEQSVRPTDVVCRVGGDEYYVLLNEVSNHEDVLRRTHEISEFIANNSCVVGERHVRVTASIGSTVFTHGQSVEDIVKMADEAMYHQKKLSKEQA